MHDPVFYRALMDEIGHHEVELAALFRRASVKAVEAMASEATIESSPQRIKAADILLRHSSQYFNQGAVRRPARELTELKAAIAAEKRPKKVTR